MDASSAFLAVPSSCLPLEGSPGLLPLSLSILPYYTALRHDSLTKTLWINLWTFSFLLPHLSGLSCTTQEGGNLGKYQHMVLEQWFSAILPPGDIWQYVEIFFVVTIEDMHLTGRGQ